MKFTINNRNWGIKRASKEWMLEEYKKECPEATYCFGMTKYSEQMIYLNDEPCEEVQRQTLLHELMHCYMWSYMYNVNQIGEEALCDISANSHDIIHEIVDRYFGEKTSFITVTDNTTGISGVTIANLSEEKLCIDNKTII